jgi:uncharacterized NAD(P)/FAD-binding protein YdhS
MLAAQLARRGIASLLIDGSGREGRGTAYSTDEPAHLLNVRAEGMSAWPDEPDHFARGFEAGGGDRKGFAERRLFGRYLQGILEEAVATGQVEVVASNVSAAAATGAGWMITFEDGSRREAGALALAIGNQPPEPLRLAADAGARFINNPWGPDAKQAIAEAAAGGGNVLVVGTGLTMIDMVLSLDAAGHQGRITALSRRGLVPRAHADFAPAAVGIDELPVDLPGLWGWLRRRSGAVGWRAAVDSLRPHSQALWQRLSAEQQRRFIRHARPWWDVHRHRIAPEVARRLTELIGEGRLEVIAGRIGSMRGVDDGVEVEITPRGRGTAERAQFAFAFNCTGPLGSIARTRDPLLKGLLHGGVVRADSLGMGLEVDERSRAVGTGRLWALGPLTKGRYWEIVAVPDIRGQVAAVADDISRELER